MKDQLRGLVYVPQQPQIVYLPHVFDNYQHIAGAARLVQLRGPAALYRAGAFEKALLVALSGPWVRIS